MNLLQSLQSEVDEILNQGGLYEILSYAWDGEDTPSARHIGLAMWLQDAPFTLDDNFWHRKNPRPNPTARDEFFLKSGEDFVGTMNFARRALGLTLYIQAKHDPTNLFDENDPFWEQHAITAQWLNIASDRLRDYFLMARFQITNDEFKKLHDKNRSFHRAFTVAGTDEGPNAAAVIKELRVLAVQLRNFRLNAEPDRSRYCFPPRKQCSPFFIPSTRRGSASSICP